MDLEVTEEQIENFRKAFFAELETKDSSYHPADIERMKTDNTWIARFLLHNDCNEKLSLSMAWDTFNWRRDFKTNEINESNINLNYIKEGAFFSHGRDKDGCALFVFKGKKHVKGQVETEEIQRCVVYWMERLERQEKGKRITIFFDMEGCGISSVDMDLIKYIIALFKHYYPFSLNYIMIFEMDWILNAVFKVIKTWLPEKAVQKIKFLKKKDLSQYVDPDQALKCWGGNDNYVFIFTSEDEDSIHQNTSSNKKVHFADGSPLSETSGTVGDREGDGGMLKVTPSTVITFIKEGNEFVSTLELQNTDSDTNITYKMKTTSPEKFRVRPSAGCLIPGARATISVTLLPGFQHGSLTRDKFLVMSMVIDNPDLSTHELTELWKNTAGKTVFQHRLRCAQGNEVTRNGNVSSAGLIAVEPDHLLHLSNQIRRLTDSQLRLQATMRGSLMVQLISTVLVLILGLIAIYIAKYEIQNPSQSYCYKDESHSLNP